MPIIRLKKQTQSPQNPDQTGKHREHREQGASRFWKTPRPLYTKQPPRDLPTYQEQLQDPRWQKMRLKILERDQWTCKRCHDTEETLHVHHLIYRPDTSPWQYDPCELLTLCASCHAWETQALTFYRQEIAHLLHTMPWDATGLHSLARFIAILGEETQPALMSDKPEGMLLMRTLTLFGLGDLLPTMLEDFADEGNRAFQDIRRKLRKEGA